MQAEFIDCDDHRWTAVLGCVRHDFYHLPEYLRFAGRTEGGAPMAFWAEEGGETFLLPLLQRSLPEWLSAPICWNDLTTPYGYSSPLMSSGDAGLFARFLECFMNMAQERQGICAFLRLHPLLNLPPFPAESKVQICSHGETFHLDLQLPEERIARKIRENHRRDIKKLQRRGFHVELDRWEDLDSFAAVYQQSMRRVDADFFYFFPATYFHDLRAAMPHHWHLCSVRSPDGRFAAGGIFAATDGILQYHLGGTADEFLPLAPSKLMFDALWRWGKTSGLRLFHLGGGLGARADSLARFKEGFSSGRSEFRTVRILLNPNRYSWLSRCRGKAVDDSDGFFPRYRKSAAFSTMLPEPLTDPRQMLSERL